LNLGQPSIAALLAATVVNLPFGTLYAFSVFLKPMEALLGREMRFGIAISRTPPPFILRIRDPNRPALRLRLQARNRWPQIEAVTRQRGRCGRTFNVPL
jgi:hypothetical protein